MSDMTLCSSLHCPVKGDCFRATAKPNPVRQSYYNFEYSCHEDNGFTDFIKNKKKGWFLMKSRKEIKVDKKVFEIADKLGKEEILCQLSEECAELIQSCLKYRRTTKGLTPKSEEEVRENLFEELSDVLMNIEQIKYLFDKELSDTAVENVIEKWHSYKADRWYRRTFISQEEN